MTQVEQQPRSTSHRHPAIKSHPGGLLARSTLGFHTRFVLMTRSHWSPPSLCHSVISRKPKVEVLPKIHWTQWAGLSRRKKRSRKKKACPWWWWHCRAQQPSKGQQQSSKAHLPARSLQCKLTAQRHPGLPTRTSLTFPTGTTGTKTRRSRRESSSSPVPTGTELVW